MMYLFGHLWSHSSLHDLRNNWTTTYFFLCNESVGKEVLQCDPGHICWCNVATCFFPDHRMNLDWAGSQSILGTFNTLSCPLVSRSLYCDGRFLGTGERRTQNICTMMQAWTGPVVTRDSRFLDPPWRGSWCCLFAKEKILRDLC